jgi:hypothetical protein
MATPNHRKRGSPARYLHARNSLAFPRVTVLEGADATQPASGLRAARRCFLYPGRISTPAPTVRSAVQPV